MGASLYFGKNLRLEPPGDDGGELSLRGEPIECENMSWRSIQELKELAERRLGISPDDWPFYGEVELAQDFPLEDVRSKCDRLRVVLARYSPEELPDNYWLRFFARILGDGADFCAKSW